MGDYGRRLPHLPAGTELKPLEGRGITLWPFLFLSLFTHLPRVSVVGRWGEKADPLRSTV
jgi:hypothetical protein